MVLHPSHTVVIPRLGLGIHEFLFACMEAGLSKLEDAKAMPWHDGV
jgi:hypothetical protein